MELEERIAALAAQQAKLRARLDTLSLAFYSLLAGELTTARCAKLKESLIGRSHRRFRGRVFTASAGADRGPNSLKKHRSNSCASDSVKQGISGGLFDWAGIPVG